MEKIATGLYKKIAKQELLWKAWKKVFSNAQQSGCDQTINAIREFENQIDRNIRSISSLISIKKFSFSPATGVLQNRANKKPRPIVVASVRDRVVLRRLLTILQEIPQIKEIVNIPTSFGGIENRNTKHGFELACNAIADGYEYYAKTDIRDFFTRIPHHEVLGIISKFTEDDVFIDFLKKALTIELSNYHELGDFAESFPHNGIGVAQGSSLSALMGNILLNSFDIEMNTEGIICLRYIDDLMLFGKSQKQINDGVKKAKRLLGKWKMQIYEPSENTAKASFGRTKDGFGFLGCEIYPGIIQPSKEKRKELINKIEKILNESVRAMSNPQKLAKNKRSLVDTLRFVGWTLQGWGNQYSFCNAKPIMLDLDQKIDAMISNYLQNYEKRKAALKEQGALNGRRLLGIHALIDSKSEPIYCPKNPKSQQ